MPTYMCIQRSTPRPEGQSRPKPSPAEMQEMYAKFNAWREKFKDNLVDLGGMLKPGGKVVTHDGSSDGPFVEVKEVVGGYMIISADDLDGAIAVVAESPGVANPGSSVEIREIHVPETH